MNRRILFSAIFFSCLSRVAFGSAKCMLCDVTPPAAAQGPGAANPCDDLFGFACQKPDGSSRWQNENQKNFSEIDQKLTEAREAGAKALGYKNLDDALKQRLKDAGLPLAEPVDPKDWKKLLSMDGSDTENLWNGLKECEQRETELRRISSSDIAELDLPKLRKLKSEMAGFLAEAQEKNVPFIAQDLPSFVSNALSGRCSMIKDEKNYPRMSNEAVYKMCERFPKLRLEAIRLFRMEGTPGYKAEAEKFVRENLTFEPQYGAIYGSGGLLDGDQAKPTPQQLEEMRLQGEIRQIQENLHLCHTRQNYYQSSAQKAMGDLFLEINHTKAAVDSLTDAFYGDKRKQKFVPIFEGLRASSKEIVAGLIKNPADRAAVLEDYERVSLEWNEKPEASAYEKNAHGTSVLRGDLSMLQLGFAEDPLQLYLDDAALMYFRADQADYAPEKSYGKIRNHQRVRLMPRTVLAMDSNPYSFLEVVAHELAHRLGPELSEASGKNLRANYRDLMTCFAGADSIRMQKNQEDETLADAVSAEIVAREIAKLPADQRRAALAATMEVYCRDIDESFHLNAKKSHPLSYLRISAIFGANPSVRKAIGCEKESSTYRACSLGIQWNQTTNEDKKLSAPHKGER